MADPVYHKTFVIGSMNWIAISCGFTYGHMAGMIRSLQKNDEGISLSEGEISLIAASVTLFFIVGMIILAVIGNNIGRRWCFILFSLPMLINWIILYYARNFVAFMLSRFMAGISTVLITLILIATPEYASPNTRALLMTMVTMVTPALGTGLSHVIGVIFHWRSLILVGMVLTIVQIFLPYFWMESPHWLASKGRYEECEQAFRKLHGNAASSEHELRQLIKIESKKQRIFDGVKKKHNFKKFLLACKKRYFWNLMIMTAFLCVYYAAAGKLVFSTLATVMLEDITGTPDVLLYTLLIDAFIFVGTCVSCFLIKKMTIRNLLFSSGLLAILILICLSACLYFNRSEVYFQWIKVVLLALYFIIIHAGPYPVIEILLGEIFPLELKFYCCLLSTPILTATVFSCIILLPTLVGVMGYHGLFLLNSAIMLSCLAYLWIRLPETKGKTLQEIEVYFKTNNFDIDEALNNEQIKVLI